LSETAPHNSDTPQNSLGAVLRRCREYHGITLDEAVEATKMGRNYLLALENDRTEEFANKAYLKGFLRTYAVYLGLNPDDMIRQFDRQLSLGTAAPAEARRSGIEGEGEFTRQRTLRQKFALPAFLLLLIIIAAGIINRTGNQTARRDTPSPASRTQPVPESAPLRATQATLANSSSLTVRSGAARATARAIQPLRSSVSSPQLHKENTLPLSSTRQAMDMLPDEQENAPSPTGTQKSFIVHMKVTRNGTLTVTIDEGQPQTYDLTVGDAIEWKAAKDIALELSDAGGVEVDINGKSLRSLGPVGKPVSLVLHANGIQP